VPTTTHLDSFAAAVDHAFDLTPVERSVTAGGFRLRLRFADAATADQFVTAFPPGTAGPPDLSIAVLLGPDRVLEQNIPAARGDYRTYVRPPIYAHWQPTPGEALQVYNWTTQRGLLWVPTSQALETVRSRPALPILHAHASASTSSPLHAAAVGRNGRFVLLAGPSGSGKSTAAVASAAAGWDYAGDDFVMVEPNLRRVEPIFASARMRPAAAALLGSFLERSQVALTNDYGEARNELRMGAGYGDVTIRGGEIVAILLPRRTGERSFAVRPARAIETYQAFVGVTVEQLPELRQSLIPKLLKMSTAVPAFVVDTGSSPDDIPAALQEFLESLG
jgi:hypothetical protein